MTLLAALLCPLLALAADGPDAVVTTKGKTLTGRVVFEDEARVVLRVKTRDTEIPVEEITEVRSLMRTLRDALDRYAALPESDLPATLALAADCRDGNLSGEALLLNLRVLLQDPVNVQANEALGNREADGTWKYKRGKKLVKTEDLPVLGRDWKDRWELETTHFRIQTNLALWDAIVAAFDLERAYRTFFELVNEELEIYDVTELMEVHIHADETSYPEPGDGRAGYFDEGNRVLYIKSLEGAPGGILAHEVVHHLFYMTAKRERGRSGQVPKWLDEGLAEYMEASRTSTGGKLAFDLGQPDRQRFAAHADADKRFDLGRMLTMDVGDFMASTNTETKYGQAYTLVHFLLHGEEGAHRELFFDVLQRAYDGQGSMSDFKKALDDRDLDMDGFEEAWHAYAEGLAR